MKRIRISSDALSDLNEGFLFYEQQDQGLGDYFTSCLRADIDVLRITGGVHRIVHRQFYRSLSRVFPTEYFTLSRRRLSQFMQLWTLDVIRSLFGVTLKK
jgi:hypothetical protein